MYYVGRYPDTKGAINWLAIREAPIRVWDNFGLGATEASGRRFYEVVVDPGKLDQLKQKVRVKASEQGSKTRD